MQEERKVLTIGQGSRQLPEFLEELVRQRVQFLVDVRSVPRSGHRPEFSGEPLSEAVRGRGIKYVFMGDLLGGRPDDPTCYINGHVDYARCREKAFFKQGIARLQRAHEQGLVVCLMCSEGEPSQCHRSKLIGIELSQLGICLGHIKPDGSVATQDDVIREVTGGQSALFGDNFQSRRAYPS